MKIKLSWPQYRVLRHLVSIADEAKETQSGIIRPYTEGILIWSKERIEFEIPDDSHKKHD